MWNHIKVLRRSTRYLILLLVTIWGILLLLHYVIIPTALNLSMGGGVIKIYDVDELRKYFKGSSKAVLLMFTKEGCPACEVIEPVFEELSTEITNVLFVEVHIMPLIMSDPDRALALLKEFRIFGTPTFIFIKNGEEVARHLGIFPGDQYEGLREFIEASLNLSRSEGEETSEQLEHADRSLVQVVILPAALGIVGAFSPCSLPLMLVLATSATRERAGSKIKRSMLVQVASIAGFTAAGGIFLSLLYMSSGYIGVDLYTLMVLLAAAFSISWGLMNLVGSEPVLHYSRRLRSLLPVLGLQCSLPFLVAALAYASTEPFTALTSALAFTTGYSVPYIASLISGKLVGLKVQQYLSGRKGLLIQGIVLTAAGVYLATEILT